MDFRTHFPDINASVCYYHLNQCMWRRIQAQGLAELYGHDAAFAHFCRQIPAIALLPIGDTQQAFEMLSDPETQGHDDRAAPLLTYFEDNFIGR